MKAFDEFRDRTRACTRQNWQLMAIIAVALLLRVLLAIFTGYAQEDAHITFRFAQNVAAGHGFAYNLYEPIYGSTTPLLTLLLALWMRIGGEPLLAARLIGLLSAGIYLYFTGRAVQAMGGSRTQALFAVALLGLSTRILRQDISGMELPLLLAFMAASLDATLRGKFNLAGLLLGLSLWTRLDALPWVLLLLAFTAMNERRSALRMAAIAAAIYLPWVVYAELIFGSAIPHTVFAKLVAYKRSTVGYLEFINRFPQVLLDVLRPFLVFPRWVTPFELRRLMPAVHGLLSIWVWLLILRVVVTRTRRDRVWVVIAWVALEFLRLGITQATFFERYLVPGFWGAMILLGWSLGEIWEWIGSFHRGGVIRAGFLVSALALIAVGMVATSIRAWELQYYRYDRALKQVGLWLKENTPPGTTVQLEPLGYAGYYSERVMIDEVGLVTPQVVQMKREGITRAELYTQRLQPDAFVIHCDDATRISRGEDEIEQWVLAHYQPAVTFDPLDFRSLIQEDDPPPNLARASCYEVWTAR